MSYTTKATFNYSRRLYTCHLVASSPRELRIYNAEGDTLTVRQGRGVGTLKKVNGEFEDIDVTEPYFYNLIKSAIQSLEAEERDQIIKEKDQLIAEQRQLAHSKNEQIKNLRQQIAILQRTINQASSEQQSQLEILQNSLQAKEAEITCRENDVQAREVQIQKLKAKLTESSLAYNSTKIEGKIRKELEDEVWKQLSEPSRKNLVAAIINYKIAKKRDFLKDYSEAVTRLCLVVETEVVIPFFEKFYEFLCTVHTQRSATFEVGGVQLREEQVYTIGQLPRLISKSVLRFRREKLDLETLSASDEAELFYQFRFREHLSSMDEQRIQEFLNQWTHPLAKWLKGAEESASILEKVRQIRNRAPHPSSVYEWHFLHLYELVTGREGLLKQLYHHKVLSQPVRIAEPRETSRGQRILSIRTTRNSH